MIDTVETAARISCTNVVDVDARLLADGPTETVKHGAVGRDFGGSHLLIDIGDLEAGEEGSRGSDRRQLEEVVGDQDG